ncbi:hypothetical protein E9993_13915 [Labilibacter sediminis]|nr:hypothetical protein E9993_13915 [Labilibacter sediminis]
MKASPLYLLIICTVQFIFFISVRAQKITVYDKDTKQPIDHVIVFNESESQLSISNQNGIIDLSLFNKTESLWLRHPAYELFYLAPNPQNGKIVYLTPKIFALDEFVVSASRTEENKKDIPYFLETVSPKSLHFKNSATSADILTSSGYVTVQKSQGGGGSPILRGFEANRVLLVVDGVRMNNGIYRSGHLQNSITIDPAILAKTELLFGPSSVIYGSDALGGVVSYITQTPILSNSQSPQVTSEATLQGMSATNTFKTNVNINAGFKKWASLTSFSYSSYGDIKMGKNRPVSTNPDDWGKVYHYSQRIDGKDSMMINQDPYSQPNTSYEQYDFLQKIRFDVNPHHSIVINSQYSTSSNISRFDQLNDYTDDGKLKYSEYYYGPQNRLFLSAKSQYKKGTKLFSSLQTTLAYQKINESRYSRKFNKVNKLSQEEKLDIYSLNMDFLKSISNTNKINYGIEVLFNDMLSEAAYTNIENNEVSDAPTRYPNGGSFFQSYAFYINYNKKISKQFSLNSGMRIGYYQYNSTFKSNDFFTPTIKDLVMKNGAPSGSIGIVYQPDNQWKLSSVFATGYRVPNVDDYGKIRAKNSEISIPNPHLKPENAYNLEFSATKSFLEENIVINLTVYHTWLNDAIVRSYFTYEGKDSIMYDDENHRMYTNINAQKAIIKGISAGAYIKPNNNLLFNATFNYTHGEVISTDEPLGHIPPIFGKISANYRYNKFRTEFYINYQGNKDIKDMSPYGEDNEEEGTLEGFPAWYTLNLASQYLVSNKITLQASVENITDRHYKSFASAISAPGRNIILSITGRF